MKLLSPDQQAAATGAYVQLSQPESLANRVYQLVLLAAVPYQGRSKTAALLVLRTDELLKKAADAYTSR